MNMPAKVKNIPKIRDDHLLKKPFIFFVLFIDIKVAIVRAAMTDIIPRE